MRYIFTLLFLIQLSLVNGQSLKGKVIDENKDAVIGATIIDIVTNAGAVTDINGNFSIPVVEKSRLVFSAVGYANDTISLSSIDRSILYVLQLNVEAEILDNVVIKAKSLAAEKREKGYAVEVIESKSYKNLSSDVNSILKTVSGVNIREVGGLGSGFNLSLNGLSGNQVRYFVDGVLMENFGSSLQLNNFPSNLIKKIEVYKGVVPVSLGADALGGAINITTNDNFESYLDASYSTGSFNTHRVSVNGKYNAPNRKYYISSSMFFNHSDNDYEMDSIKIYDLELGNFLGTQTVSRFHDQYTSGMANVKLGAEKLGWLGKTSISLTGSRNRKNYQHPDNNIKRIFGQFFTTNTSLISTLSTSKKTDNVSVSAHLTFGKIQEAVVDTSTLKYNWLGESITRRDSDPKGELAQRRSLFRLTDRILRANVNARYKFSEGYSIVAGYSDNTLRRKGKDDVDELNVSFRLPNTISKRIIALSNDLSIWKERLKSSLFAKHYNYYGEITFTQEGMQRQSETSLSKLGYGVANSLDVASFLKLKLSYEKAYRIPEPYELLGDGIYVSVNPNLTPERSNNFNIGLLFNEEYGKLKLTSDVNYFYRNSDDFIRFRPLGPFGQYENLQSVISRGYEGNVFLVYNDRIQLSTNITYQKITDENEFDEGIENTNYKSRVPNVPYLFGNVRLGFIPISNDKHKLSIYLSSRYVHEFFLNWESLGAQETKNIIPEQLTQNIELEYSLIEKGINFSAGIYNVSDAIVFDNFNIQKPGRSYNLKLRYFLTKQH